MGRGGSNGVVLITTKKGQEGRATVSYNGYYGWQTVSKKIDMLNAYEYADLVNDARNNTYVDKMEAVNRKRIAQNKQPLAFSITDSNAIRLQNTGNDYNTIVPVEILPYLRGEKGLLIQIGKTRFSYGRYAESFCFGIWWKSEDKILCFCRLLVTRRCNY